MDPINYTAAMPQADFLRDIQGGFQVGSQILQARQLQQQQAQAQQRKQQYQAAIQAATASPSPEAFADLALQYPEHREAYKQAWETISTDRQQTELRDASTIAATLHSGRPDLAQSMIEDRIEAAKNSGAPTGEYQALLDSVKADPKQAYGHVLRIISAVPGGDKVLTNLSTMGAESRSESNAPAERRKKEADATTAEASAAVAPVVSQAGADKAVSDAKTAGVAAKFAEPQALLDVQKKGWDITALKADIDYKREANRISAMNAAASREGNALKREDLQLKIDEAKQKQADRVRERVAETESGAATIDNMLNTIERLKQNPSLNDVLGSLEGRLPSVISDEGADAIGLIDTIGSQAFLSQLPTMKGAGALSDAEGKKLQAALTNLTRTQSEGQFRANLTEAGRIMLKARQNLSKRTGVPLQWPDTPAAADTPAPAKTGSGVTVSGW